MFNSANVPQIFGMTELPGGRLVLALKLSADGIPFFANPDDKNTPLFLTVQQDRWKKYGRKTILGTLNSERSLFLLSFSSYECVI